MDSKETKTLRTLVAMKPEDTQAKIFLAESLIDGFDKDAKPKPGSVEAHAILAGILKEHPDDSAANHYWIHAQEPGLHPEAALDAAKKLGRLTPNSGHMVHMPGHIFYRVGDYESGRESFENSMHVDEAYLRMQNVAVDDDWNYVHNLMYLIADLLEAGRLEEATTISAKLSGARGQRRSTLYINNTRDGISRLNPLLPVALRMGDWTKATSLLEASQPDASLVNLTSLKGLLLDYTQGMEALVAGDIAKAEARSKALVDGLAKKPAEPMAAMPGPMAKDMMAKPMHGWLDVASMELSASVMLAQGKSADADAEFKKTADAERALGYHEPPFYIRPAGETRGDALMRAERYSDAQRAYQAALAERPNSGFALYGVAQADAAANREEVAKKEYRTFLDAWKNADTTLPQLMYARHWLAVRATEDGE